MRALFLGTGTSHGVPRIGCKCDVCTSNDPKDKRYRCSLLIEQDDYSVVIDTAVEFRLQVLRANINHIDALFYTHNHADHMNGIDDVRIFTRQGDLNVYGPDEVLKDIESRFPYTVASNNLIRGLPNLKLNRIDSSGVKIGPLHFYPVPLVHGFSQVFGYRVGKLAYLTDCKEIPQSSLPLLEGVEVLIIDALRFKEHSTHMSIDEAIETANFLKVKKSYLTHLDHDISHSDLERYLPDNIYPAYDTLELII
ncbi:MAG: MBL fold metallo-hydrolase [Sphaerochaetaceae bacterium]|jgi:phosphoribosyl 1,2-cyclic phosphate phosphodiesterase